MKKLFGRLAASLLALTLTTGFAAAQSKVSIAIGGG
jgi:NitT/TauT family transport system substrate-binding protein